VGLASLRQASVLIAVVMLLTMLPLEVVATADMPDTSRSDVVSNICNNWLKRSETKSSLVGLEVMDLPGGNVLFSFNGNRRFVPASTAKVFTTACAYDTFGGDYHYATKMLAQGPIRNGRLVGDLIIVPSQDPTLHYEDVLRLISQLSAKKIKTVEGKLRIAPVAGSVDYFYPGWLAEDWGQEWMPVSSNFVIDRNVAPTGDPGRGLHVFNENAERQSDALFRALLSPTAQLAPGWATYDRSANMIRVLRSTGSSGLVVTNPSEYNLVVFERLMRNAGIRVENRTLPQGPASTVAEIPSAPLSNIIHTTLQKSDNHYAQQLLRTLGQQLNERRKAPVAPTLEQAGLDYLHSWLSGIGVTPNDVLLVDGCGLARKDCVTAHALNMVLKHMAGPSANGPYLGLLRTGSSTKTSSYRYKTGTMDSVRSISGVIKTVGGASLAVSILVNGHTPRISDVRNAMGDLTTELEMLPLASGRMPETPAETPAAEKPKPAAVAPPPPVRTVRKRKAVPAKKKSVVPRRRRHRRH
jgi:serine-type D-Ala-D-Ala carboxypeptidase/endopeptidase (penicillin-binding protein 4)